jgi:hypothetical protein
MKKLTLALLCMILAAGAAMAQKQFTFGPKIGVDYTHFWDNEVDASGQLNYQAGLFMEYRFTDKFSIAPEVVFAAQGAKTKKVIETTYHTNYINVPVLLKWYVIKPLSIDFGPQLGINVYSKETIKYVPQQEAPMLKMIADGTYDIKDVTKTVDFGVALGLTYNITEEVFVQGRYTMGMINVFETEYTSNNFKYGNAQIAIGYRF